MIKNNFIKKKLTSVIIISVFLFIVVMLILYATNGHQLVQAIYEGKPPAFLNKIIPSEQRLPLEKYLYRADYLIIRLALFFGLFGTGVSIYLFHSVPKYFAKGTKTITFILDLDTSSCTVPSSYCIPAER